MSQQTNGGNAQGTWALSRSEVRISPLARHERYDAALERLLHDAYVPPGFTDATKAAALFGADAVRARGQVFAAFDEQDVLIGTVTLVASSSPARRMAGEGEVEVHLLAVMPAARGRGVGAALVTTLLERAAEMGMATAWLWTQPGMHSAQRVYGQLGFQRVPERDFTSNGRTFLVYARAIDVSPS